MAHSLLPFPLQGTASLVTQSGALLIGIDTATFMKGIGFEKLISIGNMADVDFADLIEWLDQDVNTTCISLHIEGIRDGRRLIDVGKKAVKPIVVLKAGVSAHGAAAAASHTGSLAGASKIYTAAFNQAGIIQAEDLDNLLDRTLVLSMQPPLKGENILIITNGGGVGVLEIQDADIPLQRFGAAVIIAVEKNVILFLHLLREPFDRRLDADIIQERRAQLERQ